MDVITDHTPPLPMFRKDIINAPPTLARLLLCVQKFSLTLHYRSGKLLHLSDVISYSGYILNAEHEISGLKLNIYSLAQEVNVKATHLQDIRGAT